MAGLRKDGHKLLMYFSAFCIIYIELGGIPVLVVTQGIDFIPVLFFKYRYTVFKYRYTVFKYRYTVFKYRYTVFKY